MTSEDFYKILGVDRNASLNEIRKVFRNKVKKCHPDKAKGLEDAFKKLTEAYETLSDPNKRFLYDHSGTTKLDPIEDLAIGRISQMVNEFIMKSPNSDISNINIIEEMVKCCKNAIMIKTNDNKVIKTRVKNLQKALSKVVYKEDKRNIISDVIQGNIRNMEHAIFGNSREIEVANMAMLILDKYEFLFNQQEFKYNIAYYTTTYTNTR